MTPEAPGSSWAPIRHGSRIPHDLDAEREALAIAIKYPRKLIEDCARGLEVHHFYAPHHEAIWSPIKELGPDRMEGDYQPICERLRASGAMSRLMAHGEDQYLHTLTTEAVDPDGLAFLCRRLMKLATQRAAMISASVLPRWKAGSRVGQLWSEPPPVFVPLGIEPLDRALGGGLMEATVTLLCGGTGRGKTGLVAQIGRNWVAAGTPVLFIETELADRQIFARFLAQVMGRPWLEVLHMGPDSAPMLAELADRHLPMLEVKVWRQGERLADIVDRFAQSIGRAPRVIIDHLSDVVRARGIADARHATQLVSAEIKAIALDQKVTILAVHPVARHIVSEQNAGKRGSDFESAGKDAGELEYDAAAVLYLEFPRRRCKEPTDVLLHIAKSRGGPSDQVVPLHFYGALGLFEPALVEILSADQQRLLDALTAHGGSAGINKLATYLRMGQLKVERLRDQLEAAGSIKRTQRGVTLAIVKASP